MIAQIPTAQQIIPAEIPAGAKTTDAVYDYEPEESEILETLLPRWSGKVLVLCLLGFAITDFVITMTLSSADAAVHIVENPHVPAEAQHWQFWVTVGLLLLLGAVFMAGAYLALELVSRAGLPLSVPESSRALRHEFPGVTVFTRTPRGPASAARPVV